MSGAELTSAKPSRNQVDYRTDTGHEPRSRWLKRNKRLVSFLFVVIFPTMAVGVYFFGFAADQYVSTSDFVVRNASSQASGNVGSLLQAASLSKVQDDAYSVQEYIMSRDALAELVKSQDLLAVFNRSEADAVARFPPVIGGDTFEHLFSYYKKHVDVLLDTNTGISTLTVTTFRADDSYKITAALLAAAEQLINRMNDRQRASALKDSLRELRTSEDRVQKTASQIAEFRNRESLLDPNKQSEPMLQSINTLQTMLSRVDLQLAQLAATSPQSPLIADNKRLAAALRVQIEDAKRKITGNSESLVPKIGNFDFLSLQRDLADKQLASAILSLEAARMEADRQQIYLDTIVVPNVADYAEYPKPLESIAVFFASVCGAYIMVGLLLSSAKEQVLS